MKILQLITSFSVGGAEIQLLALTKGLARRGHRLTVAFFKEDAATARSLVPDFSSIPNVRVVDLGMERLWKAAALLRLYRLIRQGGFDLVHTHLYQANVLGSLIGGLASDCPMIASFHGLESYLSFKPLLLLNRLSMARDAKVICISNAMRDYLQRTLRLEPGKMEVVHYGYQAESAANPQEGEALLARYESGGPGLRICSIGRYSPEKGHVDLIRAMPSILKEHPGTRLFLIGFDYRNYSDFLRQEAGRLGVGSQIVFTGCLDRISSILSRMDVVVQPSLREAFGLVFLEAMAAGKPVVATTVGGIPEVVADGMTGILVPPGSPRELAAAVSGLLSDGKKREEFGQAGRRRYCEMFSLDRMVDQMEAKYSEAVGSR